MFNVSTEYLYANAEKNVHNNNPISGYSILIMHSLISICCSIFYLYVLVFRMSQLVELIARISLASSSSQFSSFSTRDHTEFHYPRPIRKKNKIETMLNDPKPCVPNQCNLHYMHIARAFLCIFSCLYVIRCGWPQARQTVVATTKTLLAKIHNIQATNNVCV